MKTKIIYGVGATLFLFAVLAMSLAPFAHAQTAVQKVGGGNNTLSNGSIVVGNNTSITTTGNGSISGNIVPTSVPWSVLTAIPSPTLSHTGDVTGNITLLAAGGATGSLTLATVNSNVGTFAGITINGKGLVTAAVNLTISTTAPLTGGGTLGNLTIAMPAATTSVNGYLTSTDWTTFNSKQAAGNYITALTGDGTAAGPGSAVFTLAAVATGATTGSSTAIPVITFTNKGLVTAITTAAVIAPAGTLTGTTLASNVVTSSLTTVGTLQSPVMVTPTLGVASSTSESIAGTGGAGFLQIANQSAAPSTPTTAGRLYWDASNRLSWIGTNGFTRTFDGTANTANRIYVLPDAAGTIALTSSTVASITGTAGQITASASTGAVTLSIPSAMTGINSITSVATTDLTLTGNSGASLVLANGSSGGVSLSVPASGLIRLFGTDNASSVEARLENVGSSNVLLRFKRNATDVGYIGNGAATITGGSATDYGISAVGSLILGSNGTTRALTIGTTQVVTLSAAVASTSTSTGALVLSGSGAGLGVAGAGYFGGALNVTGTTTLSANTRVTGNGGTPASGAGIEFAYGTSGSINVYDRSGSLYKDLTIAAFNLTLGGGGGSTVIQNGNSVALATFANSGAVTIGVSSATVTVAGNLTVSGAGTSSVAANLSVGASIASVSKFYQLNSTSALVLYRPDSTGAGTESFKLSFDANDNTATEVSYASISSAITSNGSGAHAGSLVFKTAKAGTLTQQLLIDTNGISTFASTTSGTSTTAAAVLAKSLGLTENLYVGGLFQAAGNIRTTSGSKFAANNADNSTAVEITNSGGAGAAIMDLSPNAVLALRLNNTTSTASVAFTTEATTGGAGSIITSGGFYAAKKLITASSITTGEAAFAHHTSTAWTAGSTANVPTLTTGPVTGNPTKWVAYDDAGTTRYVPMW